LPAAAPIGFAILERVLIVLDGLVEWAAAVAPDRIAMPTVDIYLYYIGLTILYHANARKRTRFLGLGVAVLAVVRDLFF
jgi:hypothetical protein